MQVTKFTHSSRPNQISKLVLLGPFAWLGMVVEAPLFWLHRMAGKGGRKTLLAYYLSLAVVIGHPQPARADFIGLDLIPLAGSLLANIRDFYLQYQKQIMAIKKMAVAYYYIRAIDLDRLKDELGELGELELKHALNAWIQSQVTGYAKAITYSGEARNTGAEGGPAEHDGEAQVGMRFRVRAEDGSDEYLTTSQIWNRLFNPYDPGWNPVTTHETFLVLKARYRWVNRELNTYRRAVQTYIRLASLYKNAFLDTIDNQSISAAIQWAVASSVSPDSKAGKLLSMEEGPLKHFLESRITYWRSKIQEAVMEREHIRAALAQMRQSMTQMERRALGMVAARIKKYSLENFNYLLPTTGPGKGTAPALKPVRLRHFSPFPRGWG